MIKIKQYNQKWRIGVEEELEFESKEEFDKNLKAILDLKEKFGRLENGRLEKWASGVRSLFQHLRKQEH